MRQLKKYLDFKDEGKFFLKIESTSGNESHVYTWFFFQKAAFLKKIHTLYCSKQQFLTHRSKIS